MLVALSVASYYREEESAGVHSFLPVKQGEKSAGVHSFFPVLVRLGRAIVWGYTLSCLLVSRERRVQGYNDNPARADMRSEISN